MLIFHAFDGWIDGQANLTAPHWTRIIVLWGQQRPTHEEWMDDVTLVYRMAGAKQRTNEVYIVWGKEVVGGLCNAKPSGANM